MASMRPQQGQAYNQGQAHGQGRSPFQMGPFNADRKHSEPERWICVYPAYLNKLKTKSEGRLVSKSRAVENPTYAEIKDVLLAAGFQPIVENKQYSRERSRELEFRGRVRVQLRNDDGTPHLDNFVTREDVFRHICEMIPQLKSRANRQAAAGASGGQGSGAAGGGGGSGGGKKSKKKK